MSDNQFNNMDDDNVPTSVEAADETSDVIALSQHASSEQVQRRTFSHWPHSSSQFIAQMNEAGFYGCNIGDRVICLSCGLVCQQWIPYIDDPCEVHRILSPNCRYVQSKLMCHRSAPLNNTNLSPTVNVAVPPTSILPSMDSLHCDEIVPKSSRSDKYAEVFERAKSFPNWHNEKLPPVDDFARAGFFYTGMKNTVTCFYCNGSLRNWGPNDNPMIEHARWFPHCAYARQLCGDDLYRKIQESQRSRQGFLRT
ncbi:unnamed protein product [Rotaria sp. Silwood2]|nr:unnamed protein product [Rotaria sp. Silwood2]CAF2552762.1 unnamed protein product [Rotaria sp. Silwood2]CAF2773963.1 unnamed protein product [Rotaria sp. Silwood2]CAF2960572.1 unnamed protein product [Rotaria sp. Silwood2]CAF3924198.1 unnamed protein product [Rotaria sp. Silwood2]